MLAMRWRSCAAYAEGCTEREPGDSARCLADRRMHAPGSEVFDSPGKPFPRIFRRQDFEGAGIRRVLLIQDMAGQPAEDLTPVLLRWQEAGISIYAAARQTSTSANGSSAQLDSGRCGIALWR
jgi:hypothetical protein